MDGRGKRRRRQGEAMTGDGHDSDNFWPGYVDAISNLVLNLLFVVAILTMAVFLFAIELGRKQGLKIGGLDQQTGIPVKANEVKVDEDKKRLEEELKDMRKQMASLRAAEKAAQAAAAEREAARALPEPPPAPAAPAESVEPAPAPEAPMVEPSAAKTPPKRVDATEKQPTPETSVDKLTFDDAAVVVVFRPDAVTMTKPEQETARKALGKVAGSGGAHVEVRIRGGFSETRRLAFYRAMAVRNLLIEMNVPMERIETAIVDAKSGGDSAKVLVRGRK
jgi:outer membrane protein OmpA-like peptidoglycan-associated protein